MILLAFLLANLQDHTPQHPKIDAWIEALAHDDIAVRVEAEYHFRALARDLEDAYALLSCREKAGNARRLQRISDVLEDGVRPFADALPHSPPEPPSVETWILEISKRRPKAASLEEDVAEEDEHLRRSLRTSRITVEMKRAPLTAVVDYFRELTGLNVHISGVDQPDGILLDVSEKDVTLQTLLRRILEPRLAHIVRDGIILISTKDALRAKAKLELYDVKDLLGVTTGDELAARIRKEIHPGTWTETGGGSVDYLNGLLIVRHKTEVQAQIRVLLAALRGNERDEPVPPPRPARARRFTHPDEKGERDIASFATELRYARVALERASRSGEAEVRQRAGQVLDALESAVQRTEPPLEFQRGVRKVRACFRTWNFDDVDLMVREAFAAKGVIEVLYMTPEAAAASVPPQIRTVMTQGGGVAYLRAGKILNQKAGIIGPADADEVVFTVPHRTAAPQGAMLVRFAKATRGD